MNSCGSTCVLFIWINFSWPIIVSSAYLLIKGGQITAKGKYFLLSTIGGYALSIGFNFLIGFLAGNFLKVTNAEGMNILALSTTITLLVPPVIFSHILFKKTVNKTSKDMADPTKRIVKENCFAMQALDSMKRYIKIYKMASIMISIPLAWGLFSNFIRFNPIGLMVSALALFALWGSYRLLKVRQRFSFSISCIVACIAWMLFLYQIIRRINFMIENNGMERADGYGSPMAFLINFMAEIYFFIPLSIIVIAGLVSLIQRSRTNQ